MNHLEAEDDGHGPVPMEVGAMKGKKGDRGKKGNGKGTFGKNLGKYNKSDEHSKRNNKEMKRRETSCKFQFPRLLQNVWKMGHKASECWQGHVHAEEVPSSSASSVAPSAATTPAAAKTAALIQEFNVEQGSGWIFGVMGGSVASVTTGTDNLWDELVLDSGSVSTACPLVFGHQFEQRGQGASARHSTTQNSL